MANNGLSKLFLAVIVIVLMLSGCSEVPTPTQCADSDFKCIEDIMLSNMVLVQGNALRWSNLHFLIQLFVAISGIVATIMIALQGDANKWWTRPVGLIATALVTGLSSALVSFHVPDNVDKLIDVYEKMGNISGQYASAYELLQSGRSKDEIEKQYREDSEFRKKVVEMKEKFVGDFGLAKLDAMRIYGSAGRLTLQQREAKGNANAKNDSSGAGSDRSNKR